MRIEGDFAFEGVSPVEVWKFLTDPERTAQCLPGCEKLVRTAAETYEMTLKVGIGPVRGAFEGTIRLHGLNPVSEYQMSVAGSGPAGFVQGEGTVTLGQSDSGTHLTYVGEVHAGGTIATVGQRMIGGAARMVIGQFFKCAMKNLAAPES